VWGNLHDVVLPDVSLHRIRLTDTETQSGRRDHTASTHRMRCETGDLGKDPHTHNSDTEDRYETYTQGIAPSSLFQTMAPTKTWGYLVGSASMDFMSWINAGPYRLWTALTSCDGRGGRYSRTNMGCTWRGTIWRCSNQAWNTGTLYQRDEQLARGVVTCTY